MPLFCKLQYKSRNDASNATTYPYNIAFGRGRTRIHINPFIQVFNMPVWECPAHFQCVWGNSVWMCLWSSVKRVLTHYAGRSVGRVTLGVHFPRWRQCSQCDVYTVLMNALRSASLYFSLSMLSAAALSVVLYRTCVCVALLSYHPSFTLSISAWMLKRANNYGSLSY